MSYTEINNKNNNNSWKDIVAIIIAAIVSTLYRIGGSANGVRWARPVGVGLGILFTLWILFGFHWTIILSAGASAGLSTTYFGFINPLFKLNKVDKYWFNWFFVGLALSLALLPWAWATNHWIGFGLRTLVLTSSIVMWSEMVGNAVAEELGRGFLIIATLFLLLIGS